MSSRRELRAAAVWALNYDKSLDLSFGKNFPAAIRMADVLETLLWNAWEVLDKEEGERIDREAEEEELDQAARDQAAREAGG